MPTIPGRVSKEEHDLILRYAAYKNVAVNELIRDNIIQSIENDVDVQIFNQVREENEPVYTHEEVKKGLGIK